MCNTSNSRLHTHRDQSLVESVRRVQTGKPDLSDFYILLSLLTPQGLCFSGLIILCFLSLQTLYCLHKNWLVLGFNIESMAEVTASKGLGPRCLYSHLSPVTCQLYITGKVIPLPCASVSSPVKSDQWQSLLYGAAVRNKHSCCCKSRMRAQ